MSELNVNNGINPTLGAAIFNRSAAQSNERIANINADASTRNTNIRSAASQNIAGNRDRNEKLMMGMQLDAQKEMEASRLRADRLDKDFMHKIETKRSELAEKLTNSQLEAQQLARKNSTEDRAWYKEVYDKRQKALAENEAFEHYNGLLQQKMVLAALKSHYDQASRANNLPTLQKITTALNDLVAQRKTTRDNVQLLDKQVTKLIDDNYLKPKREELANTLSDMFSKDSLSKLDKNKVDEYVKTARKQIEDALSKATNGKITSLELSPNTINTLTQQDFDTLAVATKKLESLLTDAIQSNSTDNGNTSINPTLSESDYNDPSMIGQLVQNDGGESDKLHKIHDVIIPYLQAIDKIKNENYSKAQTNEDIRKKYMQAKAKLKTVEEDYNLKNEEFNNTIINSYDDPVTEQNTMGTLQQLISNIDNQINSYAKKHQDIIVAPQRQQRKKVDYA